MKKITKPEPSIKSLQLKLAEVNKKLNTANKSVAKLMEQNQKLIYDQDAKLKYIEDLENQLEILDNANIQKDNKIQKLIGIIKLQSEIL